MLRVPAQCEFFFYFNFDCIVFTSSQPWICFSLGGINLAHPMLYSGFSSYIVASLLDISESSWPCWSSITLSSSISFCRAIFPCWSAYEKLFILLLLIVFSRSLFDQHGHVALCMTKLVVFASAYLFYSGPALTTSKPTSREGEILLGCVKREDFSSALDTAAIFINAYFFLPTLNY